MVICPIDGILETRSLPEAGELIFPGTRECLFWPGPGEHSLPKARGLILLGHGYKPVFAGNKSRRCNLQKKQEIEDESQAPKMAAGSKMAAAGPLRLLLRLLNPAVLRPDDGDGGGGAAGDPRRP